MSGRPASKLGTITIADQESSSLGDLIEVEEVTSLDMTKEIVVLECVDPKPPSKGKGKQTTKKRRKLENGKDESIRS